MASQATKAPAPVTIAGRLRRRLRETGNPGAAAGMFRFFKPHEQVSFYGLDTAAVRRLVRETYTLVRGAWEWTEALELCDIMVRDPHLEAKIIGVELLGRYHASFDRSLLARVEGWLADGHCTNWATVDDLAPRLVTPLLMEYPGVMTEVRRWTASPNLWLRRAAVVALIRPARSGTYLAEAYEFARRLFGDREDLMHKCTGWLLREAGRTDPARLEQYLLKYGPQIPRTTVRYAIERFPDADRKRLLNDTKRALS